MCPTFHSALKSFLRLHDRDDDDCTLCVTALATADVTPLPCDHAFHAECLVSWLMLHDECPICHYKLPLDPKPSGNTRFVLYRLSVRFVDVWK